MSQALQRLAQMTTSHQKVFCLQKYLFSIKIYCHTETERACYSYFYRTKYVFVKCLCSFKSGISIST